MADENADVREIAGMICALIFVCFFIGATTYSCTSPTLVNQEAQAVRVIEAQKMQACAAHGGSWMPVITTRFNTGAAESAMSCVTAQTLPLAEKMNTEK